MVTPTNQQAYSVAQGTSQIAAFVFQTRDPTPNDIKYDLYTGWVNTITKAIWYLEAFTSSAGLVVAQWRAVGPIVVATTAPTTSDYLYPIGQTWIDTVGMNYWGLVNVTGNVATWENLSSGVAAGILTLTGNTGGSITGDGVRNVNLIGSGGVSVTGNAATHTLTVALAGGGTAITNVEVDAFSSPGTEPVVPNTAGQMIVTGGQIPASSTANVIQTNSLAANTYTVQIQRSKAEIASTIGSNGVAHFNANQFIVDNNGFVSSSAFTSINIVTIDSSSTYTPTTGMKYCIVEMWGAGGAGGGAASTGASQYSCGGGGGGGGYVKKYFSSSTIGASQSVTIGTGGIGVLGAKGGDGSASSFGSFITATGGIGGTVGATSSQSYGLPGAGGAGMGGNVNGQAEYGYVGITNAYVNYGGDGANSFLGNGGTGSINQVSGDGASGQGPGSGGGGASNDPSQASARTGGDGSPGICVITEYI